MTNDPVSNWGTTNDYHHFGISSDQDWPLKHWGHLTVRLNLFAYFQAFSVSGNELSAGLIGTSYSADIHTASKLSTGPNQTWPETERVLNFPTKFLRR